MKKEFSIYLDLVRFVAAALVFIAHSNDRLVISQQLLFAGHARAAVIVFFILSGYVISYITAEREKTALTYWSSRLSRFYSLVIPALCLTPLLDMIGQSIMPEMYVGRTTTDFGWFRFLISLGYLNEIWTMSIMPFSNVPFWSLCYEMSYYALFAAVAFTAGKVRMWLVLGLCLLIGPKILLLAPIWAFGVVLHRWKALENLPVWFCWALFSFSVGGYWLFQHYQMTEYGIHLLQQVAGAKWDRLASFSRPFITDYPLALIVSANFIGFRGIAPAFRPLLLTFERPIRWIAAFTFPLYVLHQPFLLFYAALLRGDPSKPLFYLSVATCTLLSVGVIGHVVDRKRYRLRNWIEHRLKALTSTPWWQKRISTIIRSRPLGI